MGAVALPHRPVGKLSNPQGPRKGLRMLELEQLAIAAAVTRAILVA
jgi:hypothetical protein